MIAKSRGSECLAGVGPLGYHVPAVTGDFHPGNSSRVEQQPWRCELRVQVPFFRPKLLKTAPIIK